MTDIRGKLAGYRFQLILFSICCSIVVSGYYFIQHQKQTIITDACLDLSTIADLKTSQIVAWRRERLIEATSLYFNTMLSHRITELSWSAEESKLRKEFESWMGHLRDAAGYNKVMLFRPDGKLITSVSIDATLPKPHYHTLVTQAALTQEIIFTDLQYDAVADTIDIDLLIPIIDRENGRNICVAVILIDIDPYRHLYPLIRSWAAPSFSGESLLVRREGNDVLYLSTLRFKNAAELRYRSPLTNNKMPAAQAALGREGVFSGVDYRGVPVYAALRSIPDSTWAIVVKTDTREILEPISEHIRYVIGAGLLFALATVMALSLWWKRKREAYLRTQYETELEFNRELKRAQQSLLDANNNLEERVATRTGELSNANDLLRQEIAERKQIEEKLLQSRKLETIGQIASGVAHEVRNPLNAILSITEALFREKEIDDNPEYTPYITHIRTQVNRLADLMNDLLDLGKPVSPADARVLPLLELCSETMELWKVSGMAENRQGVVSAADGAAATLITADRVKLQQILFNLLENSGHYSTAENTIILHLAETEPNSGMAVVRIIDRGPGIPVENIPRIFEPFYSNRRGGTGLGLSLVKHFIENMGGSVRIWNNDPPPGCTAELHIPLAVRESE